MKKENIFKEKYKVENGAAESFYKRKQSDEAEYKRRCEYQIAVNKKLEEQGLAR